MKTLYDQPVTTEVKRRVDALRPDTAAMWGKMNAAQAVRHCSLALEMALGDSRPPRLLIGRVLGPLFKPIYSNEKPMQPGSPTHKSLIVGEQRDLDQERAGLAILIDRFSAGGAEACTRHPHPFFGKLTPAEWGTGMYKHLDHHLRQFGV
jgi:Protein of unknown function (DUF1569)